jgi:hypothetical protein
MRRQPGTSELRALLYADEVMGFAPPSAEPPTKRGILTLYKQARAHGLGVVMATQNPVDLDYKLMSNAGTWMVGRLQTERDKARILEALESATGASDLAAWDARIGALGKRQFLLKSARSNEPDLFTTRWAMSYLRGPLTRTELMALDQSADVTTEAGAATSRSLRPELGADESATPPQVADGVLVRYLDPAASWASPLGIAPSGSKLEPGLAVTVRLLFDERVGEVRHEERWEAVFFPLGERLDADDAVAVDHDPRDFRDRPLGEPVFALGDAPIQRKDFFTDAGKAIEEHLFRDKTLSLFKCPPLKMYSRPDESEEQFRARCLAAAEDRADEEAEKLRDRYERRLDSARKRVAQAERRVRELDVDVGQRKQQELVAGAGEVLSMFLGGRRRVRSLSGLSSRRSQTRRTQERLRSAVEKVEEQQDAVADLEEELTEELDDIWARWQDAAQELEPFEVALERNDVSMDEMVLFWAPVD